MSKVIEFPTQPKEKDALHGQLRQRMQDMDELYQRLDAAHEVLNTLEAHASVQEKQFDECLTQYAGLIGPQNLEVQMLQYSSNTKIVADPDTKEFRIEWNGEDE